MSVAGPGNRDRLSSYEACGTAHGAVGRSQIGEEGAGEWDELTLRGPEGVGCGGEAW